MSSVGFAGDSLNQLGALLDDVGRHLQSNSKAERRAAALKLERIATIAATLAATVYSVR
jgi:hypothetical protein